MSRSYRLPASFICFGARPEQGKRETSKRIRRKSRQLFDIILDYDFYNLDDPMDKKRTVNKNYNWGWMYFGDGKYNPFKALLRIDSECLKKLIHK